MVFRNGIEKTSQFASRVLVLGDQSDRPGVEPAAVWRRAFHVAQERGRGKDRGERFLPAGHGRLCRGTASFDLVHWLGERHDSEVATLRMTGVHSKVRDVASDYVDVDGAKGASMRRVVAMARNGLQLGA